MSIMCSEDIAMSKFLTNEILLVRIDVRPVSRP